ncbi:hypothetical protein C7C46_11510 [Streptomyces tateyamensis]|uniref:Uncharacterized protein n=2 Tax=Streptomyces tateyamensis TaxID=565073 RepID=A0A2V4NAT6_9ACTN|nr:hypothetical protein C7C46_11510 [Streptomyces tateyamensis]
MRQRQEAADALEDFQVALTLAGVTLPSAGLDPHEGQFTGQVLIDLGRVSPATLEKLTDLLRAALTIRAQSAR